MKKLIQQIIEHNSPLEASDKILKLVAKYNVSGSFTIDDLRKAFEGGRKSVKGIIKYYPYTDGETYATTEVVKSFKQYIHENYR